MQGQIKCMILKGIRRRIAEENDIPYEFSDCEYHGKCSGSCPKCMSELLWLEEQLKEREASGKPVTVTVDKLEKYIENASDKIMDIEKSSEEISQILKELEGREVTGLIIRKESFQPQEDDHVLTGDLIREVGKGPYPHLDQMDLEW